MSDNNYIHKFDKQFFQGSGYSQFVPNSRELKQGPWIQPHQYIHRTVVHIDSKDRFLEENGGPSKNPEPNKYSINLPTVYKNVLSVELLEGDFHRTDERIFISQYKNNLDMNGTTFTIPPGEYYNIAYLISVINPIIPGSIVLSGNKLEFDGTATLQFGTGPSVLNGTSLHSLFGFRTTDVVSGPVQTGTYPHNLNCENSLLIVSPQLQHIEASNKYVSKSFAIIKFDVPIGSVQNFNAGDYPAVKVFEPIEPKLKKIDFEFRNTYGELYNFQGCDHSMTLEIREVRQNNN
jgi:hypothetical protein